MPPGAKEARPTGLLRATAHLSKFHFLELSETRELLCMAWEGVL